MEKAGGGPNKPLFARWTSEFDCNQKTEWWYCIKDKPLDMVSLKAKRRYVINTGNRNFEVKTFDAIDLAEKMAEVYMDSFSVYPDLYRPVLEKAQVIEDMKSYQSKFTVLGAFLKETGELCGFSCILENDKCLNFVIQKTRPSYEKLQINAALVYGICKHYEWHLLNGYYICDGERAINHITNFQDYLEKYFGFRKAYCKLNLKYRFSIKLIVKLLYPFRKVIHNRCNTNRFFHNIDGVLQMENIVRNQRKLFKS